MWHCYFLMRNGWMLHFLNLFHDKSFHPHWVSFKPWPSFKPCKIIYFIQVDYFLPEMVGTTSMLGFFFQILELFSYGIFYMNLIYIIWKQICLHVLAFDWLVCWSDMELSSWHYVSSLKFPILKLFKTLDFSDEWVGTTWTVVTGLL